VLDIELLSRRGQKKIAPAFRCPLNFLFSKVDETGDEGSSAAISLIEIRWLASTLRVLLLSPASPVRHPSQHSSPPPLSLSLWEYLSWFNFGQLFHLPMAGRISPEAFVSFSFAFSISGKHIDTWRKRERRNYLSRNKEGKLAASRELRGCPETFLSVAFNEKRQ
jgi:hypothetical protein